MRVKHLLLNILPLPLWIFYYLFTISKKELFMMSFDINVYVLIISTFTIYNLFSRRVIEFLTRNLIGISSLTIGCLISGQVYLKLCYHMSDEHYVVNTFPFVMAMLTFVMTAIGCVFSYFILRKR